MPQAIPLILDAAAEITLDVAAAGAPAWVAAAAGFTTIGTLAAAGLYASSALASALAPSTPTPTAQRNTIRQSLPPRYRGCGHGRMGGALLVDYAEGQNLRVVVAFADCVLNNIDRRWINQDQVRLSGTSVVALADGAYSRISLDDTFGVHGTTAFPALNAQYPAIWAATAYGTGVHMGLLSTSNGKIEAFSKDFHGQSQLQYNVAADIDVHYDWRDGSQSQVDQSTWRNSANPVVALVNDLWRNHDYVWSRDFAPSLAILTASANVCDEPVPILNVLAELDQDAAAGDHSVRLESVDGLADGMAINIAGQVTTVTSITARGDGTFDVGVAAGLSAAVAAGGMARWVSNPASPQTKRRYEAHGRWLCQEDEADTTKRLLECCDGWMMRRGSDAAVIILAGSYTAPDASATIGLGQIIDFSMPELVDIGRVINELVPAYVEPANNYNQIDSTPWRADDSVTSDGLASQAFPVALVQSNSQIRRLAKARMSRLQQPPWSLTLNASGIGFLGKRYLQLPVSGDADDGLTGQLLEVIGDFQIVDSGMHVQIPVQLFDPACYSWNYLTEEGPGPSVTAAPVASPLTAPTITEVDPFFDDVSAGASGVRLRIYASGPDRDDLTWYYRWRVTGATAWKESTYSSAVGGTVEMDSDFVPADASIDVEAAYSVGAGTPSPYSPTTAIATSTAAVAPSNPALGSFTATGAAGSAALSWRNSTSANFDHIIVSRAAHGAAFGTASPVGAFYGAPGAVESDTDTAAAGAYDYWVTAYNAAGTPSAHVGPVSATIT